MLSWVWMHTPETPALMSQEDRKLEVSLFYSRPFLKTSSWVLVAHTCSHSYSGNRNQEGHGLKTA
jgi:hypothetical protein